MDTAARDTRDRMLLAARRLIAARGVDGVGVRDILQAADVRNGGAMHYYFGSKDDLIRELIEMGARRIDERRISALDELDAGRVHPTPRALVDILVQSAIGVSRARSGEDSYIRFALAVRATHPSLYEDAIAGRWDIGYRRLVGRLREAMPRVAPALLEVRLMLSLELINAVLARREAYLVDTLGEARWGDPGLPGQLAGSVLAVLEADAI